MVILCVEFVVSVCGCEVCVRSVRLRIYILVIINIYCSKVFILLWIYIDCGYIRSTVVCMFFRYILIIYF